MADASWCGCRAECSSAPAIFAGAAYALAQQRRREALLCWMGDVWRALSRMLPVRLHRWRRPGVRHVCSICFLRPYPIPLPHPCLQPSSQPSADSDYHSRCTTSKPLPAGGASSRKSASIVTWRTKAPCALSCRTLSWRLRERPGPCRGQSPRRAIPPSAKGSRPRRRRAGWTSMPSTCSSR